MCFFLRMRKDIYGEAFFEIFFLHNLFFRDQNKNDDIQMMMPLYCDE